jgi:hypothetical protein
MIGEDGLARNILKLKHTARVWWDSWKPHLVRWCKRPLPHEYTNLWVEACRAEPYFFGHVLTFASYVAGVAIVVYLFLGA